MNWSATRRHVRRRVPSTIVFPRPLASSIRDRDYAPWPVGDGHTSPIAADDWPGWSVACVQTRHDIGSVYELTATCSTSPGLADNSRALGDHHPRESPDRGRCSACWPALGFLLNWRTNSTMAGSFIGRTGTTARRMTWSAHDIPPKKPSALGNRPSRPVVVIHSGDSSTFVSLVTDHESDLASLDAAFAYQFSSSIPWLRFFCCLPGIFFGVGCRLMYVDAPAGAFRTIEIWLITLPTSWLGKPQGLPHAGLAPWFSMEFSAQ